MFQQGFDNLKKSARDLIMPVPLSQSGHDRFFHPPFLNKAHEPPFATEEVRLEWVRMLLLQVIIKVLNSFKLKSNTHAPSFYQDGKKGFKQVVLVATRQLHFWHLVNEMSTIQRSSINNLWWDGFHKQTHSERIRYLEAHGTNASTYIFWIHLNMSFFGLYKAKCVMMRLTKGFNGTLAMKEIAMALFLTATDTRREAYYEDYESHVQVYKPDSPPTDSIIVCGLSASQVDTRNQFLLSYCEDMLTLHKNDEGEESYKVAPPSKSLTNVLVNGKDGSNGSKSMFWGQPIFFSNNAEHNEAQPAPRGELFSVPFFFPEDLNALSSCMSCFRTEP